MSQYFSTQKLPFSSININNNDSTQIKSIVNTSINQATPPKREQQILVPTTVFLINAHRVGMRAMDSMGLRNRDDCRSFTIYSKTPIFCDEIQWLFEDVSTQLGDAYVHSFCEKVSICVASPFLLFNIVKKSIKVF